MHIWVTSDSHKRKPYDWLVCEEGFHKLSPQLYHPLPQVDGDAAGLSMGGVHPHAHKKEEIKMDVVK